MNQLIKHLAIFFAVALSLTACGKAETTTNQENTRKERVQVQKLSKTEIARELNFSTVLQGYETQNVAPSLTGHIEHIFVEVGDRVSEGTMLVRMDQNQYNTTKLTYTNHQWLAIQLAKVARSRKQLESLLQRN